MTQLLLVFMIVIGVVGSIWSTYRLNKLGRKVLRDRKVSETEMMTTMVLDFEKFKREMSEALDVSDRKEFRTSILIFLFSLFSCLGSAALLVV